VLGSAPGEASRAWAGAGSFSGAGGRKEACLRLFPPAGKGEGYQVSRLRRESVIFARHDLLSDLPFSHIDLICCRYVLMHLQPAARRVATEAFAHALDDGGYLVLSPVGHPDENVGAFQAAAGQGGVYHRLPPPPPPS